MAYELPKLPYDYAALEPHIDAKTMEIHYSKHHQGYVNNANKALEKHPELASKSVDEIVTHLASIPEDVRTALRNNAGGHSNHAFFWTILAPNKGGTPAGKLGDAIKAKFGSFDEFKAKFEAAGGGRFGSGWVWLVVNKSGELEIVTTPNQDSPLTDGLKRIIGVDVWEHAYYLHYQNRRPDYLKSIWNVINWDAAAKYFDAA